MLVTDKKYYMEKMLVAKLDILCERCTLPNKQDNLLLIDGDEGSGKSNTSIEIAYYMAHQTGRKFDVDDVYFDVEQLVNEAIKEGSYDRIFVWDEAALKGLASEWQNQWQKTLIKMLMVARKRRHIYIFNIPKFFKLNEYLVVDRSIGLLHTYLKKGIGVGYYTYYNKNKKEVLYNLYRKTRKRGYRHLFSFRGQSTKYNLPNIIDEDKYESKKDDAIMSLDQGNDGGATRKATNIKMLVKIMEKDLLNGKLSTNKYYADVASVSEPTMGRYKEEIMKILLAKHPNLSYFNTNNYTTSSTENKKEDWDGQIK